VRNAQAPAARGSYRNEAERLCTRLGEIAVASPLFLLAPFYRHWHLRWGATDAEIVASMPGGELIDHPSFNTTRAITIDAPLENVWPWLVQIGFRQGRLLQLRPFRQRWQSEREPNPPRAPAPNHRRLGADGGKGERHDRVQDRRARATPLPGLGKAAQQWVWTLKPLRGGRTRLVTRLKDRYSWRADPLNALLSLILFEFGDFAMMRRLLFGVKWRAERIQALSSSCESARLASSSIRSSRV
jgi:hypothetical protein